MPKRRTKSSIYDMLNRTVKPSDIIAVATNGAYGGSSTLRLVLLQHIYLDDSRGNAYFTYPTFFRDSSTGLLYAQPTDEDRGNEATENTPVGVDDPGLFVPVKPEKYHSGWDYDGINEVVGLQDYRIVGQPIDSQGNPAGKVSTYQPLNFVLVDGITIESLQQ